MRVQWAWREEGGNPTRAEGYIAVRQSMSGTIWRAGICWPLSASRKAAEPRPADPAGVAHHASKPLRAPRPSSPPRFITHARRSCKPHCLRTGAVAAVPWPCQ